MTDAGVIKSTVKVCMFDQYGTVVDMQTGLVEAAAPFLRAKGCRAMPTRSSPGGGGRISRTR